MAPQEPRVLLLSMPWAMLGEPSLGLGILKACLENAGIAARVRHLNLFLLQYLRTGTYIGLANAYALNDFVFTHDLEPRVSGVQRRLIRQRLAELLEIGVLCLAQDVDEAVEKLITARQTIFSRWLEECAAYVVAEKPTLVGFTCLYDQTISSIALARKIRELLPEVTIVLGGYGLAGPLAHQVLRCFPWIDAVCVGEGEPAIVPLARASVKDQPLVGIPNVFTRHDTPPAGNGKFWAPSLTMNMDESPVPSFDDYFSDIHRLNRDYQVEIKFDTLPVESSRGCWWGQKHHCVFCGIDEQTMHYRSRSPENTLIMLDQLGQRYGMTSFRFSDYIFPHSYFHTLLPELSARAEKYHIECEVKSNLIARHVKQMRAAGIGECQPGIESFSTPVLARMNKGVTAIGNILALVLGKMVGMRIHYNFLFGFPTDELPEYEAMLTVIPLLYHLDPPHGRQSVEITRFSPLQADPGRFGIRAATHAPLYETIFSPGYLRETGFDLDAYAYYFARTFSPSPALKKVYGMLTMQIDHWKNMQTKRQVELTWTTENGGITFHDSRYGETGTVFSFGSSHLSVFRACAGHVCSVDTLTQQTGLSNRQVIAILEDLAAARVVFNEGSLYLGLATPCLNVPPEKPFQRLWT